MMKKLLWFILGGQTYLNIEAHWRIPTNNGWASFAMFWVGGLCFVCIGSINQIPAFYKLSMRLQSLIGALIVLFIEFISGCILNLGFGMNIWDYSHMPANLLGQVCLLYGFFWFALMPFAIWLEDWLNYTWWYRYGGKKPLWNYSLKEAYLELIPSFIKNL